MSEKLCTLRTKGGGGAKYTETVLWTNPSPTSVMTPTTLTLSASISNYDYLRFNYNIANDDATNNSIIISVSDFKRCVSGNDKPICGLSGSSGYASTRRFDYVSDTSISVNYSVRWGQSGNSSGSCIPTSIIGIKNMGGIRTNEKYDTLPFKSVSANVTPSFATKGVAKAIWLSYIPTTTARIITMTNVNPYTGEINNNDIYATDSNSLGGYVSRIQKFVVSNGTVALDGALSSAQTLYIGLAYTY